ncbi:fumarylacetoacetate hydrolase family protein [Sphingobacterium daejeonense]|jgi:fumarylacetoacetate (FAA) hydrolase|uniref:fumarylacetoacetate hydrolase family protein n=1 Tax=Sphingobacterium daejeonense TaxID=371142 RepID=UPI0021A48AD4|nr:fumarylacetoacetate hydrolase family protein [Sphingobacterium daejeonense]MCT1529823.1 fumarylacetoacetate hydrolase family protein [Sphingobacterium daejeonense]
MKIVTYFENGKEQLGFVLEDKVFPSHMISNKIPNSTLELMQLGKHGLKITQDELEKFQKIEGYQNEGLNFSEIRLAAPLPNPTSFRDAYAFRQHVETSRLNRGLEMIPEFDQFPVFYFSNHQAIQGPGPIYCMPEHFDKMDFELEVAIVINKKGRNIKAIDADNYIAGIMILNDLSARNLQMQEMKLNLGPAKGKDFASMFGPYLVTFDELEKYKTKTVNGHIGNTYDLKMRCWVNDELLSEGTLASMHWTFAEIIERASYGVTLYPGDIIGSGTVGTGCLLELNGTAKRKDPNHQEQWLQPNDVIKMEVTGLGTLENKVFLEEESEQ